jgi:hypothetical protein
MAKNNFYADLTVITTMKLTKTEFDKWIKGAEDLTPEIISFKSKHEGVKNGRSKRIE